MNIIVIDDYFQNEILSVAQEQYLKINEINLYRYKDITTALVSLKNLIFKADVVFLIWIFLSVLFLECLYNHKV